MEEKTIVGIASAAGGGIGIIRVRVAGLALFV